MELTILGYVLIPLGLYWALFKPRALFLGLLFFVPFSASAVINIDAISLGLQPYHYLGILLILRRVANILITGRIRLSVHQRRALLFLFLFWMAVSISLVPSMQANKFGLFNITQFIHLSFGVLMTAATMLEINEMGNLKQAVSALVASGVFVGVWGLFQFVCFHLGFAYPDMLFNNSRSKATNGFLQVLGDAGTTRISSVAVEPSVFARFELIILAILLTAILVRPARHRGWSYLWGALVLGMLLLSTSTTAYFGIAVLGALLLIRHAGRMFKFLPAALSFVVLLLTASPVLRDALVLMTIQKTDSFSFVDRFGTVVEAYQSFWKAPIVGWGWGNIHSYDLIAMLLSNVGLVGTTLFSICVGTTLWYSRTWSAGIKQLLAKPDEKGNEEPLVVRLDLATLQGLQLAFIAALFADSISGFSYVFGHIWILWGLLLGGLSKYRNANHMKQVDYLARGTDSWIIPAAGVRGR